MFNKSTSNFFKVCFFITILSFVLNPVLGFTDTARDTEATNIAKDIGVTPGAWFSNTDKTMSTIKQGLLEIDNQSQDLAAKGVSQSAITAQRTEAVSALKDYAKATNVNENSNVMNNLIKSNATIEAEKGNLLKTQSNFNDTISLGYKKAGMEKEADIYHKSSEKLDTLAAEHYDKSLPSEKKNNPTPSLPRSDSKVYNLLAPIETFFPGGKIDVAGEGLSSYLDGVYKAGIAIATGLALIMIVIGGVQYISTDAIGGKSEGRQRINNAVMGLLLALGSWILLQQINPSLLKNDLNVEATKAVAKLDQVDIQLSSVKGTLRPKEADIRSGVDVSNMPQTQQMLNGFQGTINSAVQGSGFKTMGIPNMEWQAYAASLVQSTGLINYKPTDAANFFPNGQITVEGWVGIIGGIIKKESNFKPTLTFPEPAPLNYNSVGLLQLSAVDAEAKRANCNETCLKNPLRNLEVGIAIMARQLRKDNCIRCKSSGGSWRGLAAYWSTIR